VRGLRLAARFEAAFWEKSRPLRQGLRLLLGRLARRRKKLQGKAPLDPVEASLPPFTLPLVATGGIAALELQVGVGLPAAATKSSPAAFFAYTNGELEGLPANTLETLLLVAAAEDLDLLAAGWAEPSPVAGLPPSEISPFGSSCLWLARRRSDQAPNDLRGKVVPILGGPTDESATWPFFAKKDAYRFPRPAMATTRTFTSRAEERLAHLPADADDGRATVLFLLPFLAVGGAERLLFDLLASWAGKYRCLIVTIEPHQASLGLSVGRARELTPHAYTLGDWMPRETHLGVVCHLLRYYRVDTLVSWNGTTFFFDQIGKLRQRFPALRILSQLYHHQGAYFARTGPATRAALDGHLAVNHAIARALENELGVTKEKIFLLHHGVELPPVQTAEDQARLRQKRRDELGLPQDAVVIGSFLRLHPQKRPFDILALARLFAGRHPVHFLLIGGGPLEAELVAELERRSLPNLLRLPLQADARPYYDAIDLCLLTSAYEGLPIFLLDGLARGIPCVSTAVGEVPGLLEEGGGYCAATGDIAALEAAILRLLDETHRLEQGEIGRRTIEEKFSLAAFADAYEAALFPQLGLPAGGAK